MKLTIQQISQETGIAPITLRLMAESGKVPWLGSIRRNKRTYYSVERLGYEAYQRGESTLDVGRILREIQDEEYGGNK